MKVGLARKLGAIHSGYRIFDRATFEVNPDLNILNDIREIEELEYLHRFYDTYAKSFEVVGRASNETNVSRSVDLPYVGKSVIETGKAKYFFIFEGGMSLPEKLSSTMLACLWPLPQCDLPERIFEKFWSRFKRRKYDYAYAKLGINRLVAEQSYAIDAVRIGDENQKPDWRSNTSVLRAEIALLDPDLVVIAGRKAERASLPIRGDDDRDRFAYVPYPIWTHEAASEAQWATLREMLEA